MPPYRPASQTAATTTDEWISYAALAPEVRARLEAMGPGEPAGSASMRTIGVPLAVYLIGACVLVLAVLVGLTGPSARAFAVPSRAALFVIAAAWTGVMLACRRLTQRRHFAAPVFYLGPTTLLTVLAGHLRVLRAETLDVTADQIARPDEVIDDGVHDATWLARLMAVRSAAQTEHDAVARDPFRALLASPKRVSSARVRAIRVRTIARAGFVGALFGVFIEVVPFGLVGRRAEHIEALERTRAELARHVAAEAEGRRAAQSGLAARARAADRQRRALSGGETDAREWLQHAGILDDAALKTQVQARLDAICDQRYPARDDANPERVLFSTMLRRACGDPEQSLYYMVNDTYATEGARLISRHLREVSEWLGVPLAVQPQPMQSPDGVHPYVEIEAVPIGVATQRDPGSALEMRVQPMSMTVRLHDRDGDLLGIPAFTERVELIETRGFRADGVL